MYAASGATDSAHGWGSHPAALAISSMVATSPMRSAMILMLALAGVSVSGAGDVGGDGFDDMLIGADYADNAGAGYLVLGTSL